MSAADIISFMPSENNLDFWIKNNLNVLFHGKHGVGKTSMITDAFQRNNVKFVMFSAATMDPWVDFIGVPKEVSDEKGPYLELIKPKSFRDNEIEALVFDEFNRSHKKVRNAVMELIQFKSINGKKFPNLRMVWAAINPETSEDTAYDVEKLDPAQADRFHVHVEIPYKPHLPFFISKYGKETAHAAIDWWAGLPDDMKFNVSPRRLEMAIQMFKAGGRLMEVLPPASNTEKLLHSLKNGSPLREFRDLVASKDEAKIKDWLSAENNYNAVVKEIMKEPESSLHLIEEEKVCALLVKSRKIEDYVFSNFEKFKKTIEQLAVNSSNKTILKRAAAILNQAKGNHKIVGAPKNGTYPYVRVPTTTGKWAKTIGKYHKWNATSTNFTWANGNNVLKIPLKKSYATLSECHSAAINKGKHTYERLAILECLINAVRHPGLTLSTTSLVDIKMTLQLFDWLANRTQTATLFNQSPNLQTAINHCISNLIKLDQTYTVSTFTKEFPNIVGKLFSCHSVRHDQWIICQ